MKINPERLQELRKRKRLTRQRLSDLAGIHARTIQRLEKGLTLISVKKPGRTL